MKIKVNITEVRSQKYTLLTSIEFGLWGHIQPARQTDEQTNSV